MGESPPEEGVLDGVLQDGSETDGMMPPNQPPSELEEELGAGAQVELGAA